MRKKDNSFLGWLAVVGLVIAVYVLTRMQSAKEDPKRLATMRKFENDVMQFVSKLMGRAPLPTGRSKSETAGSSVYHNGSANQRNDELEAIRGIGTVSATRLRQAGVNTFAALAATSADRLRENLGPGVFDLDDILAQARQMAGMAA